jgi:hypothetical protein
MAVEAAAHQTTGSPVGTKPEQISSSAAHSACQAPKDLATGDRDMPSRRRRTPGPGGDFPISLMRADSGTRLAPIRITLSDGRSGRTFAEPPIWLVRRAEPSRHQDRQRVPKWIFCMPDRDHDRA